MDEEILELKKKLKNYKKMQDNCYSAPAKDLLNREIKDIEKKIFELR